MTAITITRPTIVRTRPPPADGPAASAAGFGAPLGRVGGVGSPAARGGGGGGGGQQGGEQRSERREDGRGKPHHRRTTLDRSRPAYSAAIYGSLACRVTCSKRSSLTTAPARMMRAIT